ncbi:NAD(P)-binding protein [Punctularia strigosozonata HHB-11173 SS5]|uniref:NAD(P)-binding protein n=1 Tax=Punctularia strigosozonata (strain HHB-11173) TaxID=741275 RepID=UPI0004416C06|nr:NAD(P)-binding protein [Punctularia strigosozonata HHB-11173 SS5]EIN11995.1 NAD(P)-binding protein [Punctularia strigosozonata HHB-11173 SS5]
MAPKIWFITGCSVGFGRAITEYVLEKGDTVVATLRNPEVLDDLSDKYKASQLLVLQLDVSKLEQIKVAFAKATETFGRIDVVVNNAGYGILAEVEGTPSDAARALFEVNFWGMAAVASEAIRFFRDVNQPQGGQLLHMSSMLAFEPKPGLGFYAASKYAADGLMESLSMELNPAWNIRLIIVEPGAFETRGTKSGSLVDTPQHPAYAYSGSLTAIMRQQLPIATLPGDPNKAARAIHALVYEPELPLHVLLGEDAVDAALRKGDSFKEYAEKARVAHFAQDLKLEAFSNAEVRWTPGHGAGSQ